MSYAQTNNQASHHVNPIKERILRLPEVISKTGLSRSGIYALLEAEAFPKAIKLGARRVGWLESEIEAWIADIVRRSRFILKS